MQAGPFTFGFGLRGQRAPNALTRPAERRDKPRFRPSGSGRDAFVDDSVNHPRAPAFPMRGIDRDAPHAPFSFDAALRRPPPGGEPSGPQPPPCLPTGHQPEQGSVYSGLRPGPRRAIVAEAARRQAARASRLASPKRPLAEAGTHGQGGFGLLSPERLMARSSSSSYEPPPPERIVCESPAAAQRRRAAARLRRAGREALSSPAVAPSAAAAAAAACDITAGSPAALRLLRQQQSLRTQLAGLDERERQLESRREPSSNR